MSEARQLFLNAARQGQSVFVPVHIEKDLIDTEILDTRTKRAAELSISVAQSLKGVVPMLITTLSSKALIQLPLKSLFNPNKYGLTVRDGNFSAIDNPRHSKFLERNQTSVALISGVATGLCVDWTIANCLNRNIKPIVIMDATDLDVDAPECTRANRAAFERASKKQWLDMCLTTCASEVNDWADELAL